MENSNDFVRKHFCKKVY